VERHRVSERRHAKAKWSTKRGTARRPTGRPNPVGRGTRPATSLAKKLPAKKVTAKKVTAKKVTAKKKPAGRASSKLRPFAWRSSTRSTTRPTATSKASPSARPTGATAANRVAAETRRNRIPVALSAAAAVVVLVTSFPLSILLGQHRQLSAEAAQLSSIQHRNSLLAEQRLQLNSNAEVKRLARQNYQLVEPGQALYLILPSAGQSTSSTPGASSVGDPANQPLVAPAQAPNMSPDPGLPVTTVPASAGAAGQSPTPVSAKLSGGFWSRVGSTLQFWK
jgi:cell division protein FtsB